MNINLKKFKLKINIFELILLLLLIQIACFGFLYHKVQSVFSVKNTITLVLFFFTFLFITKINKKLVIYLFTLSAYLIFSLIVLFVKKINTADYLTVFLAFYNITFLLFFVGKKAVSIKYFNVFFRGLLIVFVVKYIYITTLYPWERPIVFYENNYELLFLSILLVANIKFSTKTNFLNLFMFAVIALLSTSRSGIAIFFFVILVCFFKREYFRVKYLWIYALIGFSSIVAISVVLDRMPPGGVQNIDRLHFLYAFLDEIENWSLWEYLFGTPIITPLSEESCTRLVWYKDLFSYSGNGTCYSVILHSFILRVILDHGFFGLFFLFFVTYKILALSGFSTRYNIAIIGILLLNSLSISSLNSIFAIFAIMIIIMVKFEKEPKNRIILSDFKNS